MALSMSPRTRMRRVIMPQAGLSASVAYAVAPRLQLMAALGAGIVLGMCPDLRLALIDASRNSAGRNR